MTFTHPVALWLALALPAVVFAFLIRRKIRRRVVPTLFLWEEALGKSFAKARSFKLRNALALLIALLIASAFIGATTEPIVGDPSRGALIVVLDNSASMNAVEASGTTRFELALRALERVIANKSDESEILILTSAGGASVVSGFTRDASAALKTLEGVEATHESCAMSDALASALFFRDSRGEESRVLVLSDGCFEGAEEFGTLASADDRIYFERIGSDLANVALETFEARRSPIGDAGYEATIAVANESDREASFDVEIGLDGTLVDLVPFKLEARERALRTLKYESSVGGTLTAQVIASDASVNRLEQDDFREVPLDGFPTIDVLFYGEVDRFMQTAFASEPNVTTRAIAETPDRLGDNELLVVCGEVPERLPVGKVALINPSSGADLFEVGEEEFDSFVEPGVAESALTRFAQLEGVGLQNLREIYPYDGTSIETYARTPEAPAIFEISSSEDPNSPRWVFNFSCSSASLVLRTTFPILFANLIGAARGFSEARLLPKGNGPRAESNLYCGVVSSAEDRERYSPTGRFSLWKLLAASGVVLASLEYYWHCRRRV